MLCTNCLTSKREEVIAQVKRLLDEGNVSEAKKKSFGCLHIDQDLVRPVIEALQADQVDYLVAPYEANAQIAYLVRNGFAHFALTEDSNLILYGCQYILFKYNPSTFSGLLFDAKKLSDCFRADPDYKYDFVSFRRFCILSGCDFLPNLRGIGLVKAKKFFSIVPSDCSLNVLYDMPTKLKSKTLVVDEEYVEGFKQAEQAFNHELVFDPRTRTLVRLNNLPSNLKENDMDFAGSVFKVESIMDFVFGGLDYKTLKPIDSWVESRSLIQESYFNDKDSIWNAEYGNFSGRDFKHILDNKDVGKSKKSKRSHDGDEDERRSKKSKSERKSKEDRKKKSDSKKVKKDSSSGKSSVVRKDKSEKAERKPEKIKVKSEKEVKSQKIEPSLIKVKKEKKIEAIVKVKKEKVNSRN